MADLIRVEDPADPRLRDYQSLRDVQLRQSLEARDGLFIAEGAKVVRRALEAGYAPRSFLMAERWMPQLADVLAPTSAPCFVVSEALAEQVTGFHVHRGALASLARRTPLTVDEVLSGVRTVVVLEDIVDHTNVGAIFRNAAGLGVDAILIAPRCADPLYRRSVKVSMGAVFVVPWTRLTNWDTALTDLAERGFATIAMALSPQAVDIAEAVAGKDRVALVFGGEGHGLSQRWLSTSAQHAAIAMEAGIDSLNVAASSAIACHAARHR